MTADEAIELIKNRFGEPCEYDGELMEAAERLADLLAWKPGPPTEPGRYDLLIRSNRHRSNGKVYHSAGKTLANYKDGDNGAHPRTWMVLDDMAEVAFDDDQEIIAHFRIPEPPKAEVAKL